MEQIKKHARAQLRQVSQIRVVGFSTAVEDLGTHLVCGYSVPYSRNQVWNVLKGRQKSLKLLKRIAERRPDLFDLHYVPEDVRKRGMDLVNQLNGKAKVS